MSVQSQSMPVSGQLLIPVPGANPAGADLSYQPIYLAIREARREDEDLPQGEWQEERKTADYGQVIRLASDVLTTQSKDLQVAAWLTEALLRHEGLTGLHRGLVLLQSLMEQFWDHLYPLIDGGDLGLRTAPLNWVGGYLDFAVKSVALNHAGHDWFKYHESRKVGYESDTGGDKKKMKALEQIKREGKLTADEFDKAFVATPKAFYKQFMTDLDASGRAVKALESFCESRFGDDAAPQFLGLRRALGEVERVGKQLLQKKLEADPDPVKPEPGMAAVEVASDGGQRGTVTAEPTDREDATARIAVAARFLQREEPTNPASYLLLRGLRWGELRAGGPELDPKLLAAPPTQIRSRLRGLMLDGKWSELLETCEWVMARPHGRGWLDLQRYVLTACDALGGDYDRVAAAIRGALTSLLQDLPQLPALTLMDDTPTTNAETRAWLQEQGVVQSNAGEGSASTDTPRTPALKLTRSAWDRAQDELRAGRPEQAVATLQREVEQEKSPRSRFLRRAEMVDVMVESGLHAVAMPILRELEEQIGQHKLEDWEAGNLVAKPLGLLFRCVHATGGQGSEDLYLRICRLDPILALALRDSSGDRGEAKGEAAS